MKAFIATLMLLMACAQAKSAPGDRQLIEHAKAADVERLDPSLPSQRLEDWLRATHIEDVTWTSSNCCNCDRRDDRMCVKFAFARSGVAGWGILDLGARRTGLSRSPRLLSFDVPPLVHGPLLAELPRLVASQEHALQFVRNLDVSRLDPKLPSQTLDVWLRKGPPGFESVTWRLSDCDLKDDPKLPLCARFTFQRGPVSGFGSVAVGTMRDGILGPPRFMSALVSAGTGSATRGEIVEELSDIATVAAKYLTP